MSITPELVKKLRERTGVGMGKCKEALVEAQGDIEQAIEILRKKGVASAIKKGDRETKEGKVIAIQEGNQSLLLEINAETDFVIQSDRFKQFVESISDALRSKMKEGFVPNTLESLLSAPYNANSTFDEYRSEMIQTLGENIQFRRCHLLEQTQDESLGIYSHMGGTILSAVVIAGSNALSHVAKDVAMHVAAEAPQYLSKNDISEDILEKERDIARSQVSGKPQEIIEKIVDGKMDAFCKQVSLVSQPFVKDSSKAVDEYVKGFGANLTITQFIRWEVGESL